MELRDAECRGKDDFGIYWAALKLLKFLGRRFLISGSVMVVGGGSPASYGSSQTGELLKLRALIGVPQNIRAILNSRPQKGPCSCRNKHRPEYMEHPKQTRLPV